MCEAVHGAMSGRCSGVVYQTLAVRVAGFAARSSALAPRSGGDAAEEVTANRTKQERQKPIIREKAESALRRLRKSAQNP